MGKGHTPYNEETARIGYARYLQAHNDAGLGDVVKDAAKFEDLPIERKKMFFWLRLLLGIPD